MSDSSTDDCGTGLASDREDRGNWRLTGIGADSDCTHQRGELELVAATGLVTFYRCGRCDGVLVRW